MQGFRAEGCARLEWRLQGAKRPALSALLLVLLTLDSGHAEQTLRGLEAAPPGYLDVAARAFDFPVIAASSAALVAIIAVILHLATRRKLSRCVSDLETQLAGARAKLERAALTMQRDRQVVVCWDRPDAKPTLEGDFALVVDVPEATRVLDYAYWLDAAAAVQVVEASERLLNRGEVLFDIDGHAPRATRRNQRKARVGQRGNANSGRVGGPLGTRRTTGNCGAHGGFF